jgi:hypothetical protein
MLSLKLDFKVVAGRISRSEIRLGEATRELVALP